MKIRTLLAALTLTATLPIAVLAAVTVERLWTLQREAQQERFQERVSAIRLALDTELTGMLRGLHALSESSDFSPGREQPGYLLRFERLLANNPLWAGIALRRVDGSVEARLRPGVDAAELQLDAPTLQVLERSRSGAISELVSVAGAGGQHLTYASVPVLREGALQGSLYIGVRSEDWRGFLSSYPIAPNATLTLSDHGDRIIARTLNHAQWVGKPSGPAFRAAIVGRDEGSALLPGLEGQDFYVAFSRLRSTGWVLGTGVPRTSVEAALLAPTWMALGGGALTLLIAGVGTWLLGRRIVSAMSDLTDSARTVATQGGPPLQAPLPVDEAETVRLALSESANRLASRETALNEALTNERAALAAAERSGRSKDEFLAMLGHELRNPLSAMRSAVHVLGLPGLSSETDARARAIVARQLGHLAKIVDDMLDVSRMTTGKLALQMGVVDLDVVVRNVVDSFNDAGRCKHLKLTTTYAPVKVMGDETRLEQIVANLLDNACKYTPAGGTLRVTVSANATQASVSVEDTGTGIAPELLPHVFSVFEQGVRTLDRSQGGLGLGLAVVDRLVKLHGGTVHAASEGIDRGAVFTFTLDRAPVQAAGPQVADAGPPELPVVPPRAPGPGPEPGPRLSSLRIVVVEDNADSRAAIVGLLELEGHSVRSAADGREGVAAILGGPTQVALVDIGLPVLDGLGLAREVRVRGGAAPRRPVLVALTGYGSDADRERALAAGFDAFLVKPFDLSAFNAALQEVQDAITPPMA